MHNLDATSAPFANKGRSLWSADIERRARLALSLFVLFLAALPIYFGGSAQAFAETRTLKIYFVHTRERAEITFKRNGRYDANGLRQLNNIVRDWRRNEPTKMDPRLFDLVWEVYRRAGATGYINVVSGYRSPATNSMLRSRSAGVAKESQHMRGTAMDFFIPGVQLSKLRELGVRMQAGGVGYYPRSGSPFVHLDVGGVRAWPRMTRQELVRIFPDGKTLHIPADGKPLPGYQQAVAEYKQRVRSGSNIVVAEDRSSAASPGRSRNLLSMLFGGGGGDEDEEEDVGVPAERPTITRQPQAPPAQVMTAAAPPQATRPVIAAVEPMPEMLASIAPVPQARPAFAAAPGTSLAAALYSPTRSAAQDAVTNVVVAPGSGADNQNFPDLAGVQIPVPTLLGQRGLRGDAQGNPVLTASVDPNLTGLGQQGDVNVPIPAGRPALAEALLASADVEALADEADEQMLGGDDAVGRMILSPEAAQALAQSNKVDTVVTASADTGIEVATAPAPILRRPTQSLTAPAGSVPPVDIAMPAPAATPVQVAAVPHVVPVPATAPHVASAAALPGSVAKPAPSAQREVAMLSAPKPVMRPVDFGDAFDPPKPAVASGVAAGNPEKGRRPGAVDAEAAKRAVTGAPVLTSNMLSTWALNRGDPAGSKATKAPRLGTRSIAADTGAFYAVGFKNGVSMVDPGRFGPAPATR